MRRILGCFIILMIMMTSQIFAGTVYYVDATNGNDLNDGLYPETAWKTIAKINVQSFSPGDFILFKRGEIWREQLTIPTSGTYGNPITFGAYGNGAKPKLMGSVSMNNTENWTNESGNLWYSRTTGPDGGDIGNLIMDSENSIGVKCANKSDLDSQGKFWYDSAFGQWKVYMYSVGNPTTYYNNNIECAKLIMILTINNKDYITLENLNILYGAYNGIQIADGSDHIIVQDCDVSYIGGGYYTGVIRSGNGVNQWKAGDDIIVRRCHIWQVYDYAISTHGSTGPYHKTNQKFYYNIIRNCEASFEIMTYHEDSDLDNIYFENNTCYDAGDVWSHNQRSGGLPTIGHHIHIIQVDSEADVSVYIRNNIFKDSTAELLTIGSYFPSIANLTLDYNCYYKASGDVVDYQGDIYTMAQFSSYQSEKGKDANSIASDPLFYNASNNNFHLKPVSPCIDAGTYVGLTEDYAEHTLPYGWGIDIGAYEYVGDNPLYTEINASPTSGWVPLTVYFTGSASGGTPSYTYSWNFGDDTSSSDQNPSHTYSEAGDYTVYLTVTDSESNQDNDSLIINASAVIIAPLQASFIASPTSGEVPLTVSFTGSATGGVLPYSYSWDFGDGTSSSEQNPSHIYNDAGDYAVYLTVTDSESNQDSDFLIINANAAIPPYLSCSPKSIYFGAATSGNETTDQYLRIINAGSGTLTWNIEDDADWLSCSPSSGTDRGNITVSVNASGLSLGLYIATITVSSPEAYNSPQYVSVNLRVYEPEQENPPFGSLNTPVDGSTVSGSIPITGWALDDIEVVRLEIKRNSDPVDLPEAIGSDGLVYIGDAVFVEGARPDVEKSYSDYPLNSRAGWGYMLLTNDLPYRGNGSFTIYGFAYDAGGHREEIGRKTILCDNINRIRPFGTIDTPKQGESIRGSEYINFRWALTPLPKTIPKDGSTIWVWVDGVQMGEAVYNQYREDIATLYPEYNNVPGAEGYYYLDTTQYENGVHTITWSAMDDGGEVDGIGSRYFSVDNIETGNVHVGRLGLKSIYQEDVEGRLRIGIKEVRRGYRLQVDNEWEINKKTMDKILTDEMDAKRGYRLRVDDRRRINKMGIFKIQPEEMETRRRYRLRVADRRNINTKDILRIKIEEMEPLRIVLEEGSGKNMKYIGWGENKWKDLPIGSTLDREKGIFSWIPTPGFIGRYVFHFAITDGSYMSKPLRVVVNVIPKSND